MPEVYDLKDLTGGDNEAIRILSSNGWRDGRRPIESIQIIIFITNRFIIHTLWYLTERNLRKT